MGDGGNRFVSNVTYGDERDRFVSNGTYGDGGDRFVSNVTYGDGGDRFVSHVGTEICVVRGHIRSGRKPVSCQTFVQLMM